MCNIAKIIEIIPNTATAAYVFVIIKIIDIKMLIILKIKFNFVFSFFISDIIFLFFISFSNLFLMRVHLQTMKNL